MRTSSRQLRRIITRLGLLLPVVALLASCTWPAALSRPSRAVPRVGILAQGTRESRAPLIDPFRQGLHDLGYVEGQNIELVHRYTDGQDDRLPDLAAELVALGVDVILTSGGTSANSAAKQSTSTIPVVMGTVGVPVATGLVASLAKPGGNLTGLTIGSLEISSKRLELLRDIVPRLSRIALFTNRDNAFQVLQEREVGDAARAMGLQLQVLDVRTANDLPGAFEAATGERVDALYAGSLALVTNNRKQIAELAVKHRLPVIYDYREMVDAGGLLAYGPNLPDLYRRAATYVDKILRGANPADLPVEQPTKFDFVINLKAAQALGLTFPESVFLQATDVIQ